MPSNKPLFSIIIITYNQKLQLKRILESLKLSSFKNFEVVVADDGSTVSLMDLLKLKWPFRIKYYWHSKEGWENAKCRNQAAKIAEGNYLLIVDGDTLFGEDTINSYLAHLQEDKLLWGLRHIINPAILNKKITSQKIIDAFVMNSDFRGSKARILFSGANFVVPRDKFLEVMWNEEFKWYGYDDYEFFDRWVYGHNLPAAHIPNSIAYHLYHPAKPGNPMAYEIWQKTRKRLGLVP